MAKFIQICASQNDLFALDENGNIYRYNFCTKAWATLDTDADGSAPTRRMAVKSNGHRGEIAAASGRGSTPTSSSQ